MLVDRSDDHDVYSFAPDLDPSLIRQQEQWQSQEWEQ
jgi:hypothetical protein